MKKLILFLIVCIWFQACEEKKEISSIDPVNWDNRTVRGVLSDSLNQGTTYLSVYSQIYSQSEHITHDLTATVSMRNTNKADTVYINKAEYYDTSGNAIRTYFDKTIYIAPMETVEIIIDERDEEGGTGANFLFDWTVKPGANIPYFEAIMISTSGQQGLSFTTQGKVLN